MFEDRFSVGSYGRFMANTVILNKWGWTACLFVEYVVDWTEPPIILLKISQIANEFLALFSFRISSLEIFTKILKSKKIEDYTNFLKSILAIRDMLHSHWNRAFVIKAISSVVLFSLNTILMAEKWGYLADLSSKPHYHNTLLLSRLGLGASLLWNAWEKIPLLNLQQAKNFNKFTHYNDLCTNSSIIDWRSFLYTEMGRLDNKKNSLPLNDPKRIKISHRITLLNDTRTTLNSAGNPRELFNDFLEKEEKKYYAKFKKSQLEKNINDIVFLKIPLSLFLLYSNKSSFLPSFWRLLFISIDLGLSLLQLHLKKNKRMIS